MAVPATSEDDWQAQKDEVVALLSIYGEDFRIISGPGVDVDDSLQDEAAAMDALAALPCPSAGAQPLVCEALAHVDLPHQQLQLLVDFGRAAEGSGEECHDQRREDRAGSSCSTSSSGNGENGGAMPFGPKVRYLPPISLHLQLPADYPSAAAPCYSLHANWLGAGQLQRLAQHLDAMWGEQGPGMPICFTWLDWLKSSALEHLGVSDQLILQPDMHRNNTQQQQQQWQHAPASAETVAMQALRYSAAREADDFRASSWLCAICYEQVPGMRCVRLPECGHYYCSDCMATHCRTLVEMGAVDNLRCPDPGCRQVLAPYMVEQVVGPEMFARWEALLLQRTLDKMDDVVYCPRCDAVCIEDKDHFAQCDSCFYAFCAICADSWHPGNECLNPEQRLLVLERRRGRSNDAAHQADLVNQVMSLKMVNRISKPCPSCHMATAKTEGCNKMTCSYCGAAWCWRCTQRITNGYDHFKDNKVCVLFDQAEIDRWNNMMMAGPRAQAVERGLIMAQLAHERPMMGFELVHCPVCRQVNAKEGRNNLIRCFSCNSYSCCACHAWLRSKPGQHFIGAGSCKQHS